MESKPVHISLHNVSSLSVTRDLTLNIAKPLSLLQLAPEHILCSLPVMSDDQAPGADHCRVPADSGSSQHGDNEMTQLDTNTGHPQQHNGPLASSERPPLDSLIFNGLMKTLIFTG